ncbi:TolC family protein [Roseivirga sp.]|uniref:TolC family protein n=1 Tax=Roseivirga sp. TaxID=1964215 RepID=UPI003B8E4429
MKRKFFYSLLLGLSVNLAIGQSANDGKVWTLEECVKYARENNLTIRNSQLTQLQNEIAVKQSKFARLPNLNAGGSLGKSFGRTIDPVTNAFVSQSFLSGGLSANAGVNVYQGGILKNTIKQNELNLQASAFDLEKAKNDVGLSVATNFLNVLLNREQLENAKFQREVTSSQLERTKKLVEAGSDPITRQLDLESQLASNEVQVVNAENALSLALLNLKQAMQMPADQELNITIPELEVENVNMTANAPSRIYDIAVENQPEVKSAELGIQSSTMGEKIAKGAFLPSVSFSGSISTNYSDQARELIGTQNIDVPAQDIGFVQGSGDRVFTDPRQEAVRIFSDSYGVINQFDDNLGQSIRASLNIPIFSRLANTSNLQRAQITRQRAEITSQNVKNQLRQNIETAYNNATAGLKSYQASIKRVAALEESFRAAEQQYNVGSVNSVDYQVASNNLFAARTDLVRAKYEYIFRVKILDFYLGNPITLD